MSPRVEILRSLVAKLVTNGCLWQVLEDFSTFFDATCERVVKIMFLIVWWE